MIPINKPWMGEEEKREVTSVLEENTLTTVHATAASECVTLSRR